MVTIIKRVSVSSAFKIGALTTGLLFAVFGLLIALIQIPFFAMIASSSSSSSFSGSSSFSNSQMAGAGGIAMICVFYFCGLFVYAIMGGIWFACAAFFYNLVAGWVGGLEVELDDGGRSASMGTESKRKRNSDVDDLFSEA